MSSSLQPGADVVVDLELANFGRFSNSPTCRGGQGAGIPPPATGPPPGGPKSFWKQVVKSQAQRCFYNPPLPTRGCGWGQLRAVSPRGAGPRLLAGAHLASLRVSSHLVKELERLQPDVFHFVVSSLPASGLAGSPAAADHGGSVRWVGETCQSGWWYHPDCSQPGLPHCLVFPICPFFIFHRNTA